MRRSSREAAFTLVELLAVMFVIALVTALAAPAFAPGSRDLDAEAQRLLSTATLAAEEAVIRGRQYGLALFRASEEPPRIGYAWSTWDGREWQPLADRPFAQHWMPAALAVSLELEDRTLAIGARRAATHTPAAGTAPQIRFFSSGESDRFRIVIHGDAEGREITSDPLHGLEYRDIRLTAQ